MLTSSSFGKFKEFNIYDLSVSVFEKKENLKNILFIHGGPGLNSQTLINYHKKNGIFNHLNANIIFYDQRGCGKSKIGSKTNNYSQQITDLHQVLKKLSKNHKVACIIGHSYGAKLLSDYNIRYKNNLIKVYLSTADTILTPRLNNIKLDLDYLKKTNKTLYLKIIHSLEYNSLWETTKYLDDTFKNNNKRSKSYWHKISIMKEYLDIGSKLNLPINNDVFKNIRKEIYHSKDKKIKLNSKNSYHFIGYYDSIMCGHHYLPSKKTIVFYHSAHYPHIEEPLKFCEKINAIIL